MKNYFPTFGIKNISIYYWLGIFLNGWFILPNWVFYFQQHISQVQIGWIEGAAVLLGILMEVPSGVMADLLGKKKTIIAGSIFQLVACIILINASSFFHFLIGNMSMFIGFSFQSGATEAFAYDSLMERNASEKYDAVIGKYSSLSIVATLISTFIGGYLFSIAPQAPFYAWIVFLGISVALLHMTTEPRVDTLKFSLTTYRKHLKEGVKTLFGDKLKIYIVPLLGFAVFIKLYQGLVRQSMAGYFGYTGETFGYLFALVSIPAIYMSFKYDLIRKMTSNRKLIVVNFLAFTIAFFCASLTQNILVGGMIYLIINLVENLTRPLTSSIINERIESKHRATTLSTLALFGQIPYIISVTFFAYMTEVANITKLFSLYWIALGSLCIYSYYSLSKKLTTD